MTLFTFSIQPVLSETYIQALNVKTQKPFVISPMYWDITEYQKWAYKELVPQLSLYSSSEKSVKKLMKAVSFKSKGTQKYTENLLASDQQ